MEQLLIDFIKGFDVQAMISMGVIFWFMTKNMRDDAKSIKNELTNIKEEIRDLDRRLCRIEGAISSKDCCRLTDDRKLDQAE